MMAEEREVLLYCDFHGHSIKKDVFMYGCNDPDNKKENIFIRIFPLLLAKRNKMFSFKNSIFRISKDKLSTGRVVCYNDTFQAINLYRDYIQLHNGSFFLWAKS